ncbi:hypothetical protein [Microcoleus sp. Pol12B3]
MQQDETTVNQININRLSFSKVNCHIINSAFTTNCDTGMTFSPASEKN